MVDVSVVGKIYSQVKPEFLLRSHTYLELGNKRKPIKQDWTLF